ncbi:MAG: cell envelope integrity protein CreD [candidate division KSB1 bacterium]|nr:cell envelope integrity protein CreD [candidate division KSB1 bacterium]MDZ7274937.1 cell envelope integrity protein CreD [candidate division KSB1 bacterium]MDZ7286611.1 cell envelope integrity protein CreD [candidate division KSB1 bacterium]MDZ7299225.1 cell envelope integrity protein CreD [candidate division KSB1 bacterium]MDZ7308358.1 cell envelope integrity protein CreD [candidate division KSB1 bacterium]
MTNFSYRQSVGLRLFIIAGLSLLLLIPAALIIFLIDERKERRDHAILEVSEKWGQSQIIGGPILTIPYQRVVGSSDGKTVTTVVEQAHFLPDFLQVSGELTPEIRHRGIYDVVLYQSDLQVTGTFPAPDFDELGIAPKDILWQDAVFALGISDLKGIRETIVIKWNGVEHIANPGIESKDVLLSGISVKPALQPGAAAHSFHVALKLNGSGELQFLPVGKETKVKIAAAWGNPSFVGSFLPAARELRHDRFTAEWSVLHLNRNYPQQWLGPRQELAASAFGVRLLLPIDEYQKTTRSAKYAIMFIALTFLAFFMTEILNRRILHPIQYLLVGFALLVFYTLLLSLSEYLPFNRSYLIASAAVVILISAYTRGMMQSNAIALLIGGILVLLYGFLFVILQLQDYALLLGSIGLFVILALVMYLTRKIDWFNVGRAD